jgi:hypothetical protein
MATECSSVVDWRSIVRCLSDLNIFDSEQQSIVNSGSFNIDDFAQTLRDGVILCRLVNCIVPDCIDEHKIYHHSVLSEVCSSVPIETMRNIV